MLEIRDLCYQVPAEGGELGILRHIDLTVEDHKFVVVTGPNGGGKTTLARAIMGLVKPTSGQILWDGHDLTSLDVTERARLGVSYGFQQPPRFKGLRVRDLLSLAAGRPDLRKDEACRYLTRVGLCANDYLEREVDVSLSGGEVKRIEIATVLAKDADLMIFDEPEAGIDLWSFARLTETFQELHARREKTILIISHQERIIRLADEIILIAGGRIQNRGAAPALYSQIMSDVIAGCSQLEVDRKC